MEGSAVEGAVAGGSGAGQPISSELGGNVNQLGEEEPQLETHKE